MTAKVVDMQISLYLSVEDPVPVDSRQLKNNITALIRHLATDEMSLGKNARVIGYWVTDIGEPRNVVKKDLPSYKKSR